VAVLVAIPAANATGVPKFAPSTTNCTVPVGVPLPAGFTVTVAVKVTGWPKTEGLAEELTVVVVAAMLTVCVTPAEVLVLKLVSPL